MELHEYDPIKKELTGLVIDRLVTYILPGGNFGIEDGYVVMGLSELTLLQHNKLLMQSNLTLSQQNAALRKELKKYQNVEVQE